MPRPEQGTAPGDAWSNVDDLVDAPAYAEFCEGRLADPYPLLAWLRSNDPVHWSPTLNSWILTRYDDVVEGLLDRRFANDRIAASMDVLPPDVRETCAPLGVHVSNWLGYTDPPKHTRLRALLRTTFTPARAQAMEPRIRELTDALLDAVDESAEPDLAGGLAFPLPARVICEILGIPVPRAEAFHRWSDDMGGFTGNIGPTLIEIAPRAMASYVELEEFIAEMVAERQRCPRDDLIAHLAVAESAGGLSRTELTGLSVFALMAGHETTSGLISSALAIVLCDASLRAELRADASRYPAAIEEILRLEAPIQFSPRLVAEDVEKRGRILCKGDVVMLHLGAANRDPERFPEPDRLDIDRPNNRHLSFAWGPHFCLGAPLARTEATIALSRLLERFPEVRLIDPEPAWRENMTMRAHPRLRVVIAPA
jgi:pimeloyl-[acyl-carrier protein] synthase